MPSDNDISLREYVDEKFRAQEKETKILADMLNVRLEGMNQFREDLRRQATQFVNRAECEQKHGHTVEDIRFLRENRALLEGRASQLSVNITFLFALVGGLLSLAALLVSLYRAF